MRVETRPDLVSFLPVDGQERWAQENMAVEVRPVCGVEKEIIFTFRWEMSAPSPTSKLNFRDTIVVGALYFVSSYLGQIFTETERRSILGGIRKIPHPVPML